MLRLSLASVGLAVVLASCTGETFLNQTASRGGDRAGGQGDLQVAFINNTPFRGIFTYGTYNNTDQNDQPETGQFVGNAAGVTLEGNTVAPIVTLPCDRVFSVGDPGLLQLIDENGAADNVDLDEDALFVGVAFSDAELGEENASVATEGFAREVRALLGVDFPCESIIIIRFEQDDLGDAPFRADFEVIPPRDDNRLELG